VIAMYSVISNTPHRIKKGWCACTSPKIRDLIGIVAVLCQQSYLMTDLKSDAGVLLFLF